MLYVGHGHPELGAAALLKAIWWDLCLASLLTHLFVCLFICLSVCLLATLRKNFRTDLHDIFREGWKWANEQMINFFLFLVAIRITDRDPYRDTGNTCLGGGMHCPSPCRY